LSFLALLHRVILHSSIFYADNRVIGIIYFGALGCKSPSLSQARPEAGPKFGLARAWLKIL